MPDTSLATALISTVGTLVGAFGGIALTNWITVRREERQAEREREAGQKRERDQAYADLLGSARQLRLKIEIAALGPWRDMDDRLSAIENQGALVNQHVAKAALLAPPSVTLAVRSLGDEASNLIDEAVGLTKMNYHDESREFLGGEMETRPDFQKLDEAIRAFEGAVEEAERAEISSENSWFRPRRGRLG